MIKIFFICLVVYTVLMMHSKTKIKIPGKGPDAKIRTEENIIAILNNGKKKVIINNNKARKS